MADSRSAYDPSYREEHIDDTLKEFDSRISTNERRWLMTKGALAMLAAIKGVDVAIGFASTLL